MGDMKTLFDNEDWGEPQGYDITVTREGEKLETKYSVQPSLHKELTDVHYLKIAVRHVVQPQSDFHLPVALQGYKLEPSGPAMLLCQAELIASGSLYYQQKTLYRTT